MPDLPALSGLAMLSVVVESGSFTEAGRRLGMSASGVSRAITRLERRVGVRLLGRTTRQLRLTTEGLAIHQAAASHLSALDDAISLATTGAHAVRGRLRVGIPALFARHVLGPNLARFAARHPELELVVLVGESGDLIAQGLDLALRFGDQPDSPMSAVLLLQTRVLTVASPAYLARCGTPAHPEELVRHECLHYLDPQQGRPFEWEFHRAGRVLPVQVPTRYVFSDVDAKLAACEGGLGITQVLACTTRPAIEAGRLVQLFADWPDERFPLYAVRPSRRLAPASVTAFLDQCREWCAALPD
ncbi:LysR family transcriptional regulator [Rhizosaccharibacter radicis]|uniref:LysR family transcriptional regulator n=1 Tax=Rhizosaccharibacter radicis TaxID=2782605 RepID=A0ABT1W1U7_9PROT|nr:LysR family transcriptional regulator [Acetobacteraceae bacterium KSS12]